MSRSISQCRLRIVAACLACLPQLAAATWLTEPGAPIHIDFGEPGITAAYATHVQTDGRILVAGTAGGAMAVARLLPDGSLDPTFDGDGKALLSLGASTSAEAVWVEDTADGGVLLVGNYSGPGASGMVVARLAPDGSPDATFGIGGRQTLPAGVRAWCSPVVTCDASLLADGSLLVPSLRQDQAGAASVFRFRSDGVLDPDFGDAGIATVTSLSTAEFPLTQAIGLEPLPDGGALVAVSTGARGIGLIRLRPDGSRDDTFAGSVDDIAWAVEGTALSIGRMQIDDAGRPVLALVLRTPAADTSAFGALRFQPDGSPDIGFGQNAYATVSPVADAGYVAGALGLQIDDVDRILLVGAVRQPEFEDEVIADAALVRLTPDGQADTTFAPNGIRRYGTADDAGESNSEGGYAIALDADGRVILAGTRLTDDGPEMQVWRIRRDGIFLDGFE